MKWFQSDRHRQHDPEIEIWAGLPGPATEVPELVCEMSSVATPGANGAKITPAELAIEPLPLSASVAPVSTSVAPV